jgi:hypothetical protein
LSQVFFLPWYFSSWASGEPHHLGFKSQLVALSLWWVMFLVWQFFVGNLLSVVLVLFPDIFVNFAYNSCGPSDYRYDKAFHFPHSLNFYTLISFQLPFILYSYLMVLLHQLLLLLLLLLGCCEILRVYCITELRDWVLSTPASYSGKPELKSRPGDRLSWLTFS